jgi:hypothetical protein
VVKTVSEAEVKPERKGLLASTANRGSYGNSPVNSQSIAEGPRIIKIEKTDRTLPGHLEEVSIVTEGPAYEMGGFTFLISYNASALTPTDVTLGRLLQDCGWEYFTYRFNVHGNCGDLCPSGLMRVFAIADTDNGPFHPSCFGPSDTAPHEIVRIYMLVTSDYKYQCQLIPISFFWDGCTDNGVSSVTGDTTYVDRAVYEPGDSLLWDEEDDERFPEAERIPFVGTPDYCLNQGPGKSTPIRFIDFINGGVDIICSDSIDSRGDINANGLSYEIADAVMFTYYFIYGLNVFLDHIEASVAASDVNGDGISLSVSDLVYLIRVITHDASPFYKPGSVIANTNLEEGVLSTDVETGAAYLVVRGRVEPELLAANMEMKYDFDNENNMTRIVIYNMGDGEVFEGDFLGGIHGGVLRLEMAAYDGTPIKTGSAPSHYALHQCFPNPFNPVTTIAFSLPVATEYELVIVNALGRTVETYRGYSGPGTVDISWDASGCASGVYFYRLKAGGFIDTKKMVLLK